MTGRLAGKITLMTGTASPQGRAAATLTNTRIAHTASQGDLLAEDHPRRTIARAIPLERTGTPTDVARCALLRASCVTGANVVIDGGWPAVRPSAS